MWPWLLAGAVILANLATVLIVVILLRVNLRRAEPSPATAGRGDPLAAEELARLRREVDALIRQLGRLTAEADLRLDERGRKLCGLLAEVDQKLAELRGALAVTDGPPTATAGSNPRRETIRRLAGQGVDAIEIARRLDMRVGEVELILALGRTASVEQAGPAAGVT